MDMKETDTTTKPSLKLQAYHYLKSKILSCEYAPSQFLNEQKLCAEMGKVLKEIDDPWYKEGILKDMIPY